ncbi:MAG: hypothetical protein V3T24_05040 [Longimicrobiales bacterium]
MDESTIWEWENGNRRPLRRHRERIAAFLSDASFDASPDPVEP